MVVRILLLTFIFFGAQNSLARELSVNKIINARSGDRVFNLRYSVNDFNYLHIPNDAKILVKLDTPSKPEDYAAAKVFTAAFQSMYPNAVFNPQADGNEYDLVIYIWTALYSESGSINVPTYKDESTGISCKSRDSGRTTCVETGSKRVQSGERSISTLNTMHGVTASVYSPATGKSVRDSAALLFLSGDDKCRNTKNVMRSVAHILGKRTFTPEPADVEFRIWPQHIGCYDEDEIILVD